MLGFCFHIWIIYLHLGHFCFFFYVGKYCQHHGSHHIWVFSRSFSTRFHQTFAKRHEPNKSGHIVGSKAVLVAFFFQRFLENVMGKKLLGYGKMCE